METTTKEIQYKPLAVEFMHDGYMFRQVRRDEDKPVAIYHKVKIHQGKPTYDGGFEVVVIKRHDGFTIAGNEVPPKEYMPNDNDWGTLGFSYHKLLDAEVRFYELINKENPYIINSQESDLEDDDEEGDASPKAKGGRGRPRVDRPMLKHPEGEFSTQELATFNGVEYPVASRYIKENPDKVSYVRSEQRNARGKKTQIFKAV